MWSGLHPVGMDGSETEVVSRVIYAGGVSAARCASASSGIVGLVQLEQVMGMPDHSQPVLRHECDELLTVHQRYRNCIGSGGFFTSTGAEVICRNDQPLSEKFEIATYAPLKMYEGERGYSLAQGQ